MDGAIRRPRGGGGPGPGRFLGLVSFLALLAGAAPAAPLHRIFYGDEDVLRLDRGLLERAYGAKVHVLKGEGDPPRRPRRLRGTVLHLDPGYDAQFVVGDRNPQVEWDQLKKRIDRNFPGIGDIDDKWHEYNFLRRIGPAMAPPRMELATSFSPEPAGPAEAQAIARAVDRALKAHPRAKGGEALRERLVRLEALRLHMHGELGRSLIKVRLQNHSEGRLPKTDDDWLDTLLRYREETAPAVRRIEKRLEGSSVALQDEIFDLPWIEGRTLETMLDHPKRVVVQQMVGIDKEVRLHVVEGRILPGATFLRFYPVGQFLTPAEIAKVHRAVETGFLDRLPPAYRKICFTSDVFFETGTGRIRFLDLNTGLFSGYYFAEEDVFTTNRLAAALTGRTPPLLAELGTLEAEPMGPRKVRRIREFRRRYAPFFEGDVQEAFWDRILAHYRDRIAAAPRAATFRAALADLEAAGLDVASIYLQFFAWIQHEFPEAALAAAELETWARKIHAWDRELYTWVDGRRLAFSEEASDRPRPRRKKPRGAPRRWPRRTGSGNDDRDPEG